MSQSSVILFDGVCNLCCGWIRFLIRRDKKAAFTFVSIQSDAGKTLLETTNIKADSLTTSDLDTIVYIKNNQALIESEAVVEILTDLGGIWKIFGVLRLIPLSLRDKIYRYIAAKRYQLFGKRTSCFLPTPEDEKRFSL